jgi:hypothetical protein
MKLLRIWLPVLLALSLTVPLSGCKVGKMVGKGLGKAGKTAGGKVLGKGVPVSALGKSAERGMFGEEIAAAVFVRDLYEPELSEREKKRLLLRVFQDENFDAELKKYGPDRMLGLKDRELWKEREFWKKRKRKKSLNRSDVIMVTHAVARQVFRQPQKFRGVDIYARSEVYIFFPPGTLTPGSDGRQTALRKFTMVKVFDGTWRVADQSVLMKHDRKKPMTFQQFLKSKQYNLTVKPRVNWKWVWGDRYL